VPDMDKDKEQDQSVCVMEVDVAKQRDGPQGAFKLMLRRAYMRLENYAPEPR